ncbi:MAG: hypothetical protein EAZ90_20995 [Oscillatoriales cyanobacterium]|nr:MAG: hypothetical protein EAZ94_24900 [Oscillatoriales cyanobacterium]TAE19874.1 MAG: hypothetical protein EAZ93_25890 [Oscillatoriales cyanobacterium]TAE40191.1 MAG: hypothetical protein EAZ90_20995 [Oscillatoriales cyanobacterium]TAE51995.1 MAG: hypothetical protein EAZ88_16610 [Oscillatoriales cyanobacterium]TAE65359.1 MAG: hypothetical protein EAZ86_24650 [Oscillatoriales cyanobacterium]
MPIRLRQSPTKKPDFLPILKAAMQYLRKKPGFCPPDEPNYRTRRQRNRVFTEIKGYDAISS